MSKRFLFLLASTALITACYPPTEPSQVKITNNSEYNITRVVIAKENTSLMIVDERNDKLIAKGGNVRTFDVRGEETGDRFIACVEAEDTSELMCTAAFYLHYDSSKSFVWGGNDNSPAWYPIDDFPMEVL